jgi:hypothetical protein
MTEDSMKQLGLALVLVEGGMSVELAARLAFSNDIAAALATQED